MLKLSSLHPSIQGKKTLVENLSQLIANLQKPDNYDHPTTQFSVIETHISYVILTGTYVYKIKKPLNLEFLNFSTLAKRLFYCQEEIRLNKKMAPDIYLEVVKITGDYHNPKINGYGKTIEYAVKMREFSQDAIFTRLLDKQQLTLDMIRQTAQRIALFHESAPLALADNPYGTYTQVHKPVEQNFNQIRTFLSASQDIEELAKVSTWADQEHQRWLSLFKERKQNNFIRECHGNIHLGNIALVNGEPIIFDCIEFNDSLRWTDTMADLAFLAMDLEDKGQLAFANQVVSDYLQATRDYSGLRIFPYYKSYRAVVRAKIALYQRIQQKNSAAQQVSWQQYQNCMRLAMHYCASKKNALIITHGLPGSGKTTVAEYLVQHASFIHLSSDITRKQLTGLDLTSKNNLAIYEGIYRTEISEQVYQHMHDTAELILQAGYSVIVDATFIKRHHRDIYRKLAATQGVAFKILHMYAEEAIIFSRLHKRQQQPQQISEAGEDIYHVLRADLDVLAEDESCHIIKIDMSTITEPYQSLAELIQGLGL